MNRPEPPPTISLQVDGVEMSALEGQTIAAVLLASGRRAWRTTARDRQPRGLFCGIGVCYDCLVTVNDLRDVRACQRRVRSGDVIIVQDEALPTATEET